jgi:polysaccharide pyruvyl transferase WcaK-like protein
MDYLQIRYVISHCYAFIGARTHSVISAYATCVPTIALGYSVKARGIAYDLGIPEQLVVNCKQLDRPDILLSAFSFLEENRSRIYDSLKENVPEYRRRSLDAKNGLEGVL